jgi:hypothetical protein
MTRKSPPRRSPPLGPTTPPTSNNTSIAKYDDRRCKDLVGSHDLWRYVATDTVNDDTYVHILRPCLMQRLKHIHSSAPQIAGRAHRSSEARQQLANNFSHDVIIAQYALAGLKRELRRNSGRSSANAQFYSKILRSMPKVAGFIEYRSRIPNKEPPGKGRQAIARKALYRSRSTEAAESRITFKNLRNLVPR